MNEANITFTAHKVRALRKAYVGAVNAGAEAFTFEGHEFLVTYAKYLLEYLDGKFKRV